MQYVMHGKIPVNLLNPTTLGSLLKNVTLLLPENLELFAGIKHNNLYMYYQIVETAILADVHSFKIMLKVPLKAMNQEFKLYKMVVYPTRILVNQYARFVLEYQYLVINSLYQNYLRMTEWEVTQCKGQDVLICPVFRAVYDTKLITCELSLYFQLPLAQKLCRRELMQLPVQPWIEQHGTVRLYYWPQQQPVHFRCYQQGSWNEFTLVLQGGGVLYNASSCYITTPEVQVQPERNGETTYAISSSKLYLPDYPPVMADHELQILQEFVPINTTAIDQLKSRLTDHHVGGDVSTLLRLHAANIRHQKNFNWLLYALVLLAVLILILVMYQFTRSYMRKLIAKCKGKTNASPTNESIPSEIIPSSKEIRINPKE